MLEWITQDEEDPDEPTGKPASATALLASLRGAEPAFALQELGLWLDSAKDAPSAEPGPQAKSEVLALLQEGGAAHVAALQAQYLANTRGTRVAREAAWKSLVQYQSRLARALCASAGALFTAQSAARALSACRTLAKLHLVHYASVPGKLWHVAYSIHASAEKAGCSTAPVHAHSDHRTKTTVEQELLRLLMLRVSAPDMMAPEQIEVADRVVDQLGAEFTLRQPGVADNPFCFEPGSEFAPRRAKGRQAGDTTRFFGPGMGYDSLERIARQLGAARLEDFKAFGKDIAPRVQLSTVQHLLTFWHVDCPYSPPAHAAASGTLEVVHGYGQIWQYLSRALHGASELSLADSSAGVPQPPETWELRGAGGTELGAEVPQASGAWVKCGGVVGLSVRDGGGRWVGIIRRMHARPDGGLQADVAVLSREPRAQSLREVLEMGEDSVFSNASSRQFAFSGANAVILADGAEGSQPANLLLQPEHWKEGRTYETQGEEPTRFLRGLQVVRRGEDYVRATFEWVSRPG
jgi:hypothetical protein